MGGVSRSNRSFPRRGEFLTPETDKRAPLGCSTFRALRFGRLCAYLRHQKPIANAGYSILVFRFSQADLDAALNGPRRVDPDIEVAAD